MTTKAEYESPELNAAQQGWLGLQERVCVVTGAASGIGAAIAASLADVGARVALLDRDVAGAQQRASALRERGAQAIAVSCDISDAESVAAAAERVHVELGTPYALINNAGLLRPGTLDQVSLEDWQTVLSINLTGYLLSARAFSPAMRKAGQGAIVNVASIAGVFPQTGSGAYSASKAGVLLLSRQMAVEWGPDGVRSNAICPGMIRTALSAKFYEEPGFEAKRAAVTANRRIGEPQDIADVALFLASPRSAYVNGAELLVDGGMANMLMDMVPRPGFNRAA
ncbi:MAG: 2-deoxy-D-gluconate 3-dehydrogenase [Burkholderiales bacterium RIFCSPHIGHO2_01_FULL_64_960]|nr:MAG: 2-deoxy-D-gluconate 3-dehydrogenase [Burkholderiales bacterium RIFCSPHIGHO2_01_FULL_64_960]